MNIPHRVALLVSLPLLALAACGGDDSDSQDTVAPSTVAPSTVAPTTVAPATLTVTAVDFSYQDLPTEVPAGTQLQLTNDSPGELHELVAFRLPDDETRPVSELVTLPAEEMMALFSGMPATVLLAPPGGEQIPAVGDGTLAEPGRYAIICSIPTGVDPQAYLEAAAQATDGPPNVPGGPPHLVHGMWAELTVV